MSSRRLLFRVFYALGFTPWDGHPIARSLRRLVEGDGSSPRLPPDRALDVGCGTGDNAIYLAQQGWQVIGVDFTAKAVDRAREKARAAGVAVEFVQADVTRLSSSSVGSAFSLIVDNGCLHGMDDADRAAYVREVTGAAAPDARLVILACSPGSSFGVPGITAGEVERRFTPGWRLLSTGSERADNRRNPLQYHVFQRS